MGSPISPLEMLTIGKFAFDLYQKCKAAEGEFIHISKVVLETRTVIEMVRFECNDPDAIINQVDTKEKMLRKKLKIYFQNCDGALKDVDKALQKFQRMNIFQKAKWAFTGREEIAELKGNLSSFATQLDNFVSALTLEGVALVNKKMDISLGKLEVLYEKFKGDSQATVGEAMRCRSSGRNHKAPNEAQYRQLITDYIAEIDTAFDGPNEGRPRTPRPEEGKRPKPDKLGVPGNKTRSHSTGEVSGLKATSPNPTKSAPNKKKYTLECWLIQVRTTDVGLFSTRKMIKERMVRGQWKLEQMAGQFKSAKKGKLANSDELVKWVLEDRKKEDTDSTFTWYAHAAKIEDKGSAYMGIQVEHQAMVIIRRQLTPEAQKKSDEQELAERKKQEAEQKRKECEQRKKEEEQRKKDEEKRKKDEERKKQRTEQKKKAKEEKQKSAEQAKADNAQQKKKEEAEKKQLAQDIKREQIKEKALQIKKDLEHKAAQGSAATDAGPKQEKSDTSPKADKGMCRHGNQCYNPNCEHGHEKGMCRYTPCQNPTCSYRHAVGQKAQTG